MQIKKIWNPNRLSKSCGASRCIQTKLQVWPDVTVTMNLKIWTVPSETEMDNWTPAHCIFLSWWNLTLTLTKKIECCVLIYKNFTISRKEACSFLGTNRHQRPPRKEQVPVGSCWCQFGPVGTSWSVFRFFKIWSILNRNYSE